MRLLHTSDWHLGHTLKDVSREYEHRAFLAWLLEQCTREAPDCLVITGDVFDSATPPASAETMWFSFLAAARRARPAMDIVAIAGNHDSPARLGAASAVLRELDVHIVGNLPRTRDGALDLDRVVIPVAGGRGLVVAVPFVRPIDIVEDSDDPLAAIYQEALDGARARRQPHQALIAMGHLYVAGAETSMLSERRVSIGGQESASIRMFPRDIDYTALGHIHRAQRMIRDNIRYAGAPIPLALEEASYKHSVAIVDFDDVDTSKVEVRLLPIPRAVQILRIPRRGAAPLVEVLAEIAQLPARAVEKHPVDTARRSQVDAGRSKTATTMGTEKSEGDTANVDSTRDDAVTGHAATGDAATGATTNSAKSTNDAVTGHAATGHAATGTTAITVETISQARSVRARSNPSAPKAQLSLASIGDVNLDAIDSGPITAITSPADAARPYLEVVVALDQPEPRLRTTIEAAMEGKSARLIAVHVETTGTRAALGDGLAQRRLAELDPRDVFVRLWERDHIEPPGEAVLAAFDRLVAEVRGDDRDLGAS